MKSKEEVPDSYHLLSRHYGVLRELIVDNATELVGGKFHRLVTNSGARLRSVEPYTPFRNKAEDGVRELKRMYKNATRKTGSPAAVWNHCMVVQVKIRSHTALGLYTLIDEVPHTMLQGDTSDISVLTEHGWWDWVWYINPVSDDIENRSLGKWLGPSDDVGQAMCSKILTIKARVLHHSSVFSLIK